MAQSTTGSETGKAPSNKPWEGFPLTLHRTGQWCKKVRGKVYYFGRDANRGQ